MESVSVNKFRDNLKTLVDSAADRHEPLKVTRRNGADFIVMSAEDWESEQETLYILQDPYLMSQIRESRETHARQGGYRPTPEEMDEILSVDDE
jgi:antitoxin YefM